LDVLQNRLISDNPIQSGMKYFAHSSRKIAAKRRSRVTHFNRIWKRTFDIAFSLAALTVLSPLVLIVALLVKLTSKGPVFFAQERVGLNRRLYNRRDLNSNPCREEKRGRDRRILVNYGLPFYIYKFRTMVTSAERGLPQWACKDDPRITPLGKILRKTRIDELPQFINVLRGEMSIVGPRPERAFFMGKVEKEIPEFQLRLRAKPGITGLAQVRLGYTNSIDGMKKKLHFDLEYIRHLGIWSDIKILAKTLGVVISGKGAC